MLRLCSFYVVCLYLINKETTRFDFNFNLLILYISHISLCFPFDSICDQWTNSCNYPNQVLEQWYKIVGGLLLKLKVSLSSPGRTWQVCWCLTCLFSAAFSSIGSSSLNRLWTGMTWDGLKLSYWCVQANKVSVVFSRIWLYLHKNLACG